MAIVRIEAVVGVRRRTYGFLGGVAAVTGLGGGVLQTSFLSVSVIWGLFSI